MVMNKITAKIHDETAAEVKTILDEAQKKANASAAKIEAAAQTKVQEIQVQAKADAEEAGRRQVLIAELESRKNALNLKRKVLDEAFAAAETKLQQLPQADWEKLITKLVVQGAETGSEKLCVPAADKARYEGGFLTRLNAALQAAGKQGQLTLSNDTGKFSGGVVLEGTTSDYDASFPTLLKLVKNQYEHDVAAILFKTEVK